MVAEGIQLLPKGAGVFFTEQSERNALISFAAALGKPKDLQERLGGGGATTPSST